jgi:hypothetical protein
MAEVLPEAGVAACTLRPDEVAGRVHHGQHPLGGGLPMVYSAMYTKSARYTGMPTPCAVAGGNPQLQAHGSDDASQRHSRDTAEEHSESCHCHLTSPLLLICRSTLVFE